MPKSRPLDLKSTLENRRITRSMSKLASKNEDKKITLKTTPKKKTKITKIQKKKRVINTRVAVQLCLRRRNAPRLARPSDEKLLAEARKIKKLIEKEQKEDKDYKDIVIHDTKGMTKKEIAEMNAMDEKGFGLTSDTFVTICTWNMEKFGDSSDPFAKFSKAMLARQILDIYHPTFFTMQEVTNAELFEEYTFSEPIDGYLTELSNLSNRDLKSLTKEDVIELERIKKSLGKYTVSKEYGYAQGPLFVSKSYKEYYPLYYDKSVVIGTPEPYVFDMESKSLVPCGEEIKFGSSDEFKPRPLLIWRCTVMVENADYNPKDMESKQFVSTEILLGIVHTSPSLPKNGGPTVCKQVKEILEISDYIQKAEDKPFLLGGDFYANKYKTLWKVLNDRTKFQLMAPNKSTNYPGGSSVKGQIADHFVGIKGITPYGKPLTVSRSLPFALEEHDERKNTVKELSKLYKIQVDHCPVVTSMTLKNS